MTDSFPLSASIPILDAGDYLTGNKAALAPLAGALRDALANIGFYYLRGHGVPRSLIADVFEMTTRFHAQPLAAKMAIKANEHNVGYMPLNGYVSRSSRISHSSKTQSGRGFVRETRARPRPSGRAGEQTLQTAQPVAVDATGFSRDGARLL